jgi:hypothetical protein
MQDSARRFAEFLGANGRSLSPTEIREILNGVEIENWAEIDRWTPTFSGKTVTIAGETFSRFHWSIDTRRFCPGCLAESAHHRTWWDLTFMRRCPFHDMDLIDTDPSGAKLRWWHPVIDRAVGGAPLARRGVPRADPLPGTWEAYVLGRLGLASRCQVEGLDFPSRDGAAVGQCSLGIDQCFDAVLLLGRMGIGGRSRLTPEIGSGGMDLTDDIAAGFRILAGGRPAIEKCVRDVIDGCPPGSFGPEETLGWTYNWILFRDRRRMAVVFEPIFAMAMADGRYGRSVGDFGVGCEAGRRMKMEEAASALGKSLNRTKEILATRNIGVPGRGDRAWVTAITPDVIDALVAERERVVSVADAAARLGISDSGVGDLVKAGLLETVPDRWLTDDPHRNPVMRADVESLLLSTMALVPEYGGDVTTFRLFEVAERVGVDVAVIVDDLRAGVIKPVGRLRNVENLSGILVRSSRVPLNHVLMRVLRAPAGALRKAADDGEITHAEAAMFLGATKGTVQALKFAGLVRYARRGSEGFLDPLSKSSVVALAEDHAPASVYAGAMGCNPDVVAKRLRKKGVREALAGCDHGFGTTVALYHRVDARDALGLAADPEADVGLYPPFWTGFDRYLRDTGSTYRVSRHDHNMARLVSICAKWRTEIEIAGEGSS